MSERREWAGAEILALPMSLNDAGATTIRAYLVALLTELWTKEGGFSGKRPFGNSDWTYDLFKPLIVADVIWGKLDKTYGNIIDVDEESGIDSIHLAIEALMEISPSVEQPST